MFVPDLRVAIAKTSAALKSGLATDLNFWGGTPSASHTSSES